MQVECPIWKLYPPSNNGEVNVPAGNSNKVSSGLTPLLFPPLS